MASIDTKHVQRRNLRFGSLAEVIAEAERIAAADRAGNLTRLGNWTPGQILSHLAAWASYPYDGYPSELGKPPWIIKVILKLKKKQFLNGSLPQGVRIPKTKHGTFGMDDVTTDEGLARLKKALNRLDAAPPSTPNVIFGPISHDEWRRLNMRHAELHMGFLKPG